MAIVLKKPIYSGEKIKNISKVKELIIDRKYCFLVEETRQTITQNLKDEIIDAVEWHR